MAQVIAAFQKFSGILVVCPCCQEIVRLSEVRLSYAGKFVRTVLDPIQDQEHRLERRQERVDQRRDRLEGRAEGLRERARARAMAKAREAVQRIDPAVRKLRYDPQDIRVVAHPVDLVVFDGLGEGDEVRRVVFVARRRQGEAARMQRSVAEAVDGGRCVWETVRIASDGGVKVSRA
jgi:predicted Holliday junction resolvase-like endonuclease